MLLHWLGRRLLRRLVCHVTGRAAFVARARRRVHLQYLKHLSLPSAINCEHAVAHNMHEEMRQSTARFMICGCKKYVRLFHFPQGNNSSWQFSAAFSIRAVLVPTSMVLTHVFVWKHTRRQYDQYISRYILSRVKFFFNLDRRLDWTYTHPLK